MEGRLKRYGSTHPQGGCESHPAQQAVGQSDRPRESWHPWARLNLYRNPFGEVTREERGALAVFEAGDLARCRVGPGEAVQLIGDCGRGKTTRMLAIQSRSPDSSYVYIPEDGPCPAIPAGSPLLIDEAQRLPKKVRRDVFSAGLPLVLATHADLRRVLERFEYSVVTIWIGLENTPELVCRLLNRRIESSRRAPGPVPSVALEDARQLVQRFGSNVRAIEHFLYERLQRQVSEHGEVRFID